MQVALQADMGRSPIILRIVKMGDPLECRYGNSPHKVKADLSKVAHVIGKSCEVALTRTSHGALTAAAWVADHGIEAGVAFDRMNAWYQVVVSDGDLCAALSVLDGLVVNSITGEIGLPGVPERKRMTARARATYALYH